MEFRIHLLLKTHLPPAMAEGDNITPDTPTMKRKEKKGILIPNTLLPRQNVYWAGRSAETALLRPTDVLPDGIKSEEITQFAFWTSKEHCITHRTQSYEITQFARKWEIP